MHLQALAPASIKHALKKEIKTHIIFPLFSIIVESFARMTSRQSYETRNNYRQVMDHLEKNQHIVREDMDLMKGKV